MTIPVIIISILWLKPLFEVFITILKIYSDKTERKCYECVHLLTLMFYFPAWKSVNLLVVKVLGTPRFCQRGPYGPLFRKRISRRIVFFTKLGIYQNYDDHFDFPFSPLCRTKILTGDYVVLRIYKIIYSKLKMGCFIHCSIFHSTFPTAVRFIPIH